MTDDAGIAAFHAHLVELCELHGVELDEDQAREIFRASLEDGFDGDATENAFEQIVDRDFEPAGGPYDEDEDDDLEFEDEEPDEPEVDQRLLADVEHSFRTTQEKLGRELTAAEFENGVRGALDLVRKGQYPDVAVALESSKTPAKSLTEMNREEHRAFARERFREKDAEANPKPDEIVYDPDTREGMATYAKARLDGYEPAESDDWGEAA